MEKRGLCRTCVQVATCIFLKDPPVWQCEEFSAGNHSPVSHKHARLRRAVTQEVATERE